MTETPSKYYSKEKLHPTRGHDACPGCAEPLVFRYVVMGIGNKKAMFVTNQGCGKLHHLETISHDPGGKAIPWLYTPYGASATAASGLKSALEAKGDNETQVVVCVGDGAAFDIGFGGLSACAERNEDILYICYDNESYANTGDQRSSAGPWGVTTTTNPAPSFKNEPKKPIVMIMAAHRVPYAATATVAYPDDFMAKVQKAMNIKGFRFIEVLSPCPTVWMYRSETTIKLSRLAVESKMFPLFEVENGTAFTINKEPEGIPVAEYTKLQVRYRHLPPEQVAKIQKNVDEEWRRLKFLATYR